MPIYEYECRKCGHHTELLQKFSDPSITKCELCQGRMRKLISQSTFHLKGTGWYVTDYASNRDGNKEEKKEKKEKKEKTAKDTATKETKGSTDQPKKETPSTSAKKDKD